MKKIASLICIFASLAWGCTDDFPIDEDGMVITVRNEAYVGNFNLLGTDFLTVLAEQPVIDTVAQTVHAKVAWGTDLKNLYPQFSLVVDAKLSPKIDGFVDFSNLSAPKVYTVISGNRKVHKPYQIFVSVK